MRRVFLVALIALAACGGKKDAAPSPETSDIDRAREEAERAQLQAALAEQAAAKAASEAKEAQDAVTLLDGELQAFDKQVGEAVESVVASQSDADRNAAKAKLAELQKRKAELEQKVADAKVKAARIERMRGATNDVEANLARVQTVQEIIRGNAPVSDGKSQNQIRADIAAMDKKVSEAGTLVATDRASAKTRLDQLATEQAELSRRLLKAKRDVTLRFTDKLEPNPSDCKASPLDKGCW